ncbi:MAG: hypothetical protein IPJ62_14850 [Betaproteobacteria bacterium]|nr:hypothetical protein [Betaproteobacteria bacterium]
MLQSELAQHPFVRDFGPRTWRGSPHWRRPFTSRRDQVIFHEGDEHADFFLVVKGMVAIEVDAPEQVLRVQTLFGREATSSAGPPC